MATKTATVADIRKCAITIHRREWSNYVENYFIVSQNDNRSGHAHFFTYAMRRVRGRAEKMKIEYALLADAAQAVGGKGFVLGGGWDLFRAASYPAPVQF